MSSLWESQLKPESSPDFAPNCGSIVRHPPASIIQRQVPLVVQSTIGAAEASACNTTSPLSITEAASSADAALQTSASADATPPMPSAFATESLDTPRASSICASSVGTRGQSDTASTAANSGFHAFSAGLEALISTPYNVKPIASSTYFGTMKRTVFSGSTIWQTRTSATSESSMTRSASDSLVRDASRSTIC